MRPEQSKVVVGADIVRSGGSDLSSYMYALALVRNGKVLSVDEGSLGRLIRLLWENRPSILAVDNLMELGGDKKNVLKLLKLLPPETEIVQVTLEEKKSVSIRELISRINTSLSREKPNAMKTAVILAILASQGVGERLKVFKDKVRISIYAGRSGYAGGSRSDKFRRNLRSTVAQAVKRVKEELDRVGIDYDLVIRRSKGGADNAYFIVYSSRDRLYGLIKKAKGKNVIIRIRPVVNKEIFSISYSKTQSRHLIVGYDPGIKIGLVALDLEGRPVLITSGKSLDREDIASLLVKYGKPLVVATDKNPPPEMVKKLTSMLKTQLYYPTRSMTTGEKELISTDFSRKHGITVRNTHERDALSAAVKAYRVYEEKLRKLVKKVRIMNLPISLRSIEDYKARILNDESLSAIIEDIINDSVKESSLLTSSNSILRSSQNNQVKSREAEEFQNSLLQRLEEVVKEKELYKIKTNVLNEKVEELSNELARVTSATNERVLRNRKIKELMQRLSNLEQYMLKLESENQRKEKIVKEYTKLLEGLLAGEFRLVPSLRAKCISKQLLKQGIYYIDNPNSLNEDIYKKIKKYEIHLLLPPGKDDAAEYLIKVKLIPSATVRNVWSFGSCVRIINGDALERLEISSKIVNELKRKKEERNKLNLTKLEKLVRQYRLSRVNTSGEDENPESKV